jgi:hypothetical protein
MVGGGEGEGEGGTFMRTREKNINKRKTLFATHP